MSALGNRAIMAQNIERLMKKSGKSRADVCEALKIPYTTFADWINGNTYPRIDKIEAMANYFGVDKAALVEELTEEDMEIRRIQRARRNMPEKEKDRMMNVLKAAFSEYFSEDYIDDDLDE